MPLKEWEQARRSAKSLPLKHRRLAASLRRLAREYNRDTALIREAVALLRNSAKHTDQARTKDKLSHPSSAAAPDKSS